MRGFTLRDLSFVGGLSVAGGGYTIIDADAAAWVTSVEGGSGDNQTLEDSIKQAIDNYVQALKPTGLGGAPGSIWSQAAQLLVRCGPRTLGGALMPLKGPAPTNVNFVSGNYNRKNGLGKPSNNNAYIINNVPVNSVGATSHALFSYGSITANSGDFILIGRFDGATSGSLISLDEWSAGLSGRAFRSGTGAGQMPIITSTAAATFMLGSRTSSTSSTLYVDGTSVTNTTSLSLTLSPQSFYSYSLNTNNAPVTFTSSIIQVEGIFSTGLNAAQSAALRSATADYVAAVAAAIP